MVIKVVEWVSGRLERASIWLIASLSIGLMVLVGFSDYLSGPQASVAVFYVLPIALAAWWGNRLLAMFVSALTPIAWYAAQVADRQASIILWLALWNIFVRFGLISLIALLLSHIRTTSRTNARLAFHDSLTGLLNTRAFYAHAEEEIARARRYHHIFSVAYLDVDDFKQANDRYGHVIGDQLLELAAHVMRESCRATDVVARLGGDEFGILLPETDAAGAADMLHKIQPSLVRAMNTRGWATTFSIGVLTFQTAPSTVREMLQITDELMYTVKRAGKDGWQRLWSGTGVQWGFD